MKLSSILKKEIICCPRLRTSMNNSIKYIVLFVLLYSFNLIGQNRLAIQYDYANTLFNSKLYFDAVTEYQRLLFFDSQNEYSFIANYKIGQAYKAGAHFENAIEYFSKAVLNSSDEKQKLSAKLEIVRTNILRKTTERALQLLDEIEKENIGDKDSIHYWRGWTYMFADDWDAAAASFAKIDYYHELKILCNSVQNEKVSVTFAKVISYILPRAGQIYTGHYLSGLMSLGYNVLLGYLTVNSFIQNRVFDGTATGLLLWLRFYRGNIQNAEKFTVEKNIDTANKTLNYLQNNYQGQKP